MIDKATTVATAPWMNIISIITQIYSELDVLLSSERGLPNRQRQLSKVRGNVVKMCLSDGLNLPSKK